RTAFRRENKFFEFNRKAFYRNLNDDKGNIDEESVDLEEVKDFWSEMWSADRSDGLSHKEMIDLLEPMELQIDCSRERVKSVVEQQLGYLSNWKTPGPDHVFNFFIKKMYALHGTLADLMCDAIEDPETIDDPLYVGN